jgi:hypothetical protein
MHCTHIPSVLMHHALYSYTALIYCTHTLYPYTVPTHCTHTLYPSWHHSGGEHGWNDKILAALVHMQQYTCDWHQLDRLKVRQHSYTALALHSHYTHTLHSHYTHTTLIHSYTHTLHSHYTHTLKHCTEGPAALLNPHYTHTTLTLHPHYTHTTPIHSYTTLKVRQEWYLRANFSTSHQVP